jgi:hypothetical protein
VGFAGGIKLEQRQFTAIVEFDSLFGIGARTRDDFGLIAHIHKTYFAVIRVNAFFHGETPVMAAAAKHALCPVLT